MLCTAVRYTFISFLFLFFPLFICFSISRIRKPVYGKPIAKLQTPPSLRGLTRFQACQEGGCMHF